MGGRSDPEGAPCLVPEPSRYRTSWNTQGILTLRKSVAMLRGEVPGSPCVRRAGGWEWGGASGRNLAGTGSRRVFLWFYLKVRVRKGF